MKVNPLTQIDFYKADHRRQYPDGTELVYSNFTPRSVKYLAKIEGTDDKVVFFGLQYFIKWFLIEIWNNEFFKQPKEKVIASYKRRMDNALGKDAISMDHIEALHDLGFLPISIKALPEGVAVNEKIPVFTIENTFPEFFWLTNYLETILSDMIWKPCTSATIARKYKKLLTNYALETGSPIEFVQFQGHDFSFRGMSGIQDAIMSGAGHLTSFVGTDTISAIDFLEDYYNADSAKELIGCSVPACYDDQTEILTHQGWKFFKNLDKNDLVAQFNHDQTISFIKPLDYFRNKYKGKMIQFSKKGYKYVDAIVTPNHKMVRLKNNKIDFFEAGDFSYRNRTAYSHRNYLVISGKANALNKPLSDLDRLKIAFQADGSFPSRAKSYTSIKGRGFPIRFSLKKERKKDRLIYLCESLNLKFSYNKYKNGYYNFWINVPEKFVKNFSWVRLDHLSFQEAVEFIQELQYWDGNAAKDRNCICYSSVDKLNIDILQGIAVLGKIKTQYNSYLDKRGDRQVIHNLTFQLNKQYISGHGCKRSEIDYNGYVYCVSVPSKMIIVRRNNTVLISGNTEHSVMTLNAKYDGQEPDEFDSFKRLITELYPTGIVSIVSDSFDFWGVLTDILPRLKNEVMARDGKVVIRPDSGDPVKIVCGWSEKEKKELIEENGKFYQKGEYISHKDQFGVEVWGTYEKGAEVLAAEVKGAIEVLWDTFGGTKTSKGYKILDQHISLIYGDSITLQRADEILKRLKEKGFAANNIVFGIGSFTYEYQTRDTLGFAMKATAGIVDGQVREIFKKPKTDDGLKKSAKGFIRVFKDKNNEYVFEDQVTKYQADNYSELKEVFRNGELLVEQTLCEIRDRINYSLQ